MSILNALHRAGSLVRTSLFHKLNPVRSITYSFARFSENSKEENNAENIAVEKDNSTLEEENKVVGDAASITVREQVSVETSIRYMTSDAYKETYGDNLIWKLYRRNHKGAIPPKKTRETCIRGDKICGNPCPICRDEYLVLDHRNVKLLEQFINRHNGSTLSYEKTGICQKKHKELLVALTKAKDYGTITFDVPIRQYDYSEWQIKNN